MCESFVSDLCKIPGAGGFTPEKKLFFSSLQLFLQNCFLDFFSGFRLLLEIIYLAPGMRFRFLGSDPFMSGWGCEVDSGREVNGKAKSGPPNMAVPLGARM